MAAPPKDFDSVAAERACIMAQRARIVPGYTNRADIGGSCATDLRTRLPCGCIEAYAKMPSGPGLGTHCVWMCEKHVRAIAESIGTAPDEMPACVKGAAVLPSYACAYCDTLVWVGDEGPQTIHSQCPRHVGTE